MSRPDTPLERAGNDPEFEAQLRAEYHGRHDILDALWWAAHPLTTSPSGVTDPASELRELQRAAFSRSTAGTPAERQDAERHTAERRLREVERMLAEDSRQLSNAVTAIESTASAPVSVSVSVSAIEGAAAEEVLTTEEEPHPRRKYLVPLASIAVVLAAILAFPAISGINSAVDSGPTPTSTPTVERAQTEIIRFSAEGNVGDPLTILARPTAESDQPGIGSDSAYAPGSFRALPNLVSFLELYLAHGADGEGICLVVVHGDGTGMGGCVPETGFREHGIELTGTGQHALGVDFTILTESITLLENGDFSYAATARTRLRDGQTEVDVPLG